MTDHNDNLHPVTHLRPVRDRRPPSRLYTLWSSLSDAVKVVLLLGSLVGLIGGAIAAASSLATDGELGTAVRAQDAVDTKQNAAFDEIDDDVDLLFQTTVKLTTDVDYLKEQVVGMRQDIRDMDRGRPLAPLRPEPHPTPVQTSAPTAHPTPTRAP